MTKKQFATSLASLLALIASASVAADEVPLPAQIVDAFNKIYGTHAGVRAVHAKGVVVQGSFKGSAEARKLSRAMFFSGHPIPVTVRFSDAGGAPDAPDGSPDSNPHGIAIKFRLPDGSDTDMELNAFKFFPVGTGEDFAICYRQSSRARPTPQSRPSSISLSPLTLAHQKRLAPSPRPTALPMRSTTASTLMSSSTKRATSRLCAISRFRRSWCI